jgi:uncharacterized protein (TIGR03435 family)
MKVNFSMKPLILASSLGPAGLPMLIGALYPVQIRGQSLTSSVGYELASVKRSTSNDPQRHGIEFLPGGRFRSINMPLLIVFGIAYNIPTQSIESIRMRIKGMPDWMLTEPYDIEATVEKGSTPPGTTANKRNERIRLMLQSVLADRLKLRVRQDMAEMPVYALTVGAHEPALAKARTTEEECAESSPFSPISPGPGCHQFQGGIGRGLHGTAVDMSDLALYVSNWSDLPVVDQTGLRGLYAVETEGWTSTYNDNPSRLTLEEVFDRLGLKLVRTKAPVQILVIEQVQKPSEN